MANQLFQVYPSIDLRDGRVVRLQQGDFDRQTSYDVDPVAQAQYFARCGARIMHLVDLDGAKAGRVAQAALVARVVSAAGIPVQVGGGVRSTADVDALLAAGVARVVVGTAALENWDWFAGLATKAGYAGKLVLAVDAKDGIVATRGWTALSGKTAVDLARQAEDLPLAALLYTDVAVDGMLTGPNTTRTAELVAATATPVLASGGVGSVEHILACKAMGAAGVIVGRAIYEAKIDLAAAVRAVGG